MICWLNEGKTLLSAVVLVIVEAKMQMFESSSCSHMGICAFCHVSVLTEYIGVLDKTYKVRIQHNVMSMN